MNKSKQKILKLDKNNYQKSAKNAKKMPKTGVSTKFLIKMEPIKI